jgi:hypothetical protein
MKHTRNIILGSFLFVGAQFAWVGCVGPGDGGGGVDYYGGGPDVWVNDNVWVDGGGRGWYGGHGGNAYVHPSGNRGAAPARSSGGEKGGGGGARGGGGNKR